MAPINPGFATVPSAAERNGDFSQSFTVSAGVRYPINIYDPNTVHPTNPAQTTFARTQLAGNQLPSSRIDPVAKAIMQLLPLPDTAATITSSNDANYIKTETQNDKFETYMLRLDHAWNNNNHSYANLRQNHWHEINNDPFGPRVAGTAWIQLDANAERYGV